MQRKCKVSANIIFIFRTVQTREIAEILECSKVNGQEKILRVSLFVES